jgi:hypothetical protein
MWKTRQLWRAAIGAGVLAMGACVPAAEMTVSSPSDGDDEATAAAALSAAGDDAYCAPGNTVTNLAAADGPAQLLQRCFYTALSATPSPNGARWTPKDSAGLSAALAQAQCGDVIQLDPTVVYTGHFMVTQSCTDSAWLTLETAAADQLPPEGTRVSPAWAGVKSLPARPAYRAPANGPQRVLAQVRSALANQPAIEFQGAAPGTPGASHVRLIGLEVSPAQSVPQGAFLTVVPEGTDHLIIDRCWIHGDMDDPTHDNHGGVLLDGLYVAVIDSYLSDHRVTTNGAFAEAQAIAGGNGFVPKGVFKIVNNFLEATTENYIFGGGPGNAAGIPQDIEIRRNHLFKPYSWRMDCYAGSPIPADWCEGQTYVGQKYVVKNLGELKAAMRALLEANIYEHNWQGQSDQSGTAVGFTPKSQQGTNPSAQVSDLTFRYNIIRHSTGGLDLSTAPSIPGCKADTSRHISAITWAAGRATVTVDDALGDGEPLGWTNVTTPALVTGRQISIAGATPSDYDTAGLVPVVRIDGTHFSYALAAAPQPYAHGATMAGNDCPPAFAEGLRNASVHDVEFDDINYAKYTAWDASRSKWGEISKKGWAAGISCGQPDAFSNVTVAHNSMITSGGVLPGFALAGGGAIALSANTGAGAQLKDLVIRDNIGIRPLQGYDVNDMISTKGFNVALDQLTEAATFSRNVLVLGVFAGELAIDTPNHDDDTAGSFPSTNQVCGADGVTSCFAGAAGSCSAAFGENCPDTGGNGFSAVAFVNYNLGVGGDYRLCRGPGNPSTRCTAASPFARAGTDGKDIGANVASVMNYTTGVP